jgi:hypothetical protein
MSVPKWLKVSHQQVFPHRAFVVSDVTAVIDYERSTKDNKVQATDRESGIPLWQVEVLDGDPAASKRARTLSVKFATPAQPECPPNATGMPFTPVVFEGLCVLPYVDRSTEAGRIAWSFRASGMTADTGKAGSSATGRATA